MISKTGPFGSTLDVALRDDAEVGGGEALAEAATVEDVHVVVVHPPGPGVSYLVDLHSLLVPLLHEFGVGHEGELDLLDEGHLRLVEAAQDRAHVFEAVEALLEGFLAQPHLNVVSLVEMHESLDKVDVLVQSPLDAPRRRPR
jgi:hypothetical protein